jgi:hypothetical protein
MKRVLFVLVLVVGFVAPVRAQVILGDHLAWDQAGPDLATVQAYTFTHFDDGAATGIALPGVTCTGAASPFQCQVLFPAFQPGAHAIALTATDAAGASALSAPLLFTFVVVPTPPANLRITR